MNSLRQNQLSLWWQFTRREIEARHRGSHLGVLWMLLTPLIEFAIYTTVFGLIFGGRYGTSLQETHATYALGVFLSLTLFRIAADALSAAPSIIISQPNLVKKVVFPLHILPLAMMGGVVFRATISLLLFFVGFAWFGPDLTLAALWLPAVLIPLLAISVGAAWLLSALAVFLRDINQLTGPLCMVMLYTSAVFYSAEKVSLRSELAWSILRFNPLLHIVENARSILLWQRLPEPAGMIYIWFMATIFTLVGWTCFRKLRPAFADVL